MSDLELLLQDELKNPEFAEAWDETALEDQIRRAVLNARIEKRLSQKQLAEISGIRQSNISRIENEACIPTLTTLSRIAKALGKELKISIV